MKNVVCSCVANMKKEKDGNCHWRMQGKAFDLGDKFDFSNWNCGKSAATTTTPAVTSTMTLFTTPVTTTTPVVTSAIATKPRPETTMVAKATANPSNTMPALPPIKGES